MRVGVQPQANLLITKAAVANTTDVSRTEVNTSPGSRLHEMFTRWTEAAGELPELGTRLQGTQETVAQLRETQEALSGMSKAVTEETVKLINALETERTLSRQEAHAHRQLAVEVGESTKMLGDSLKGLTDRAEQFSGLIIRLDFIVNRLDSEVRR